MDSPVTCNLAHSLNNKRPPGDDAPDTRGLQGAMAGVQSAGEEVDTAVTFLQRYPIR